MYLSNYVIAVFPLVFTTYFNEACREPAYTQSGTRRTLSIFMQNTFDMQ